MEELTLSDSSGCAMHRSAHLSFLQVAHNLGDPFGKMIIPMNESLHEVASFMAFYYFFSPAWSSQEKKKRNPELQQDFQLSIAVTPLRSSTHEELCASPAAVLVALAHRVLHEAGCTHGSQPGTQHGAELSSVLAPMGVRPARKPGAATALSCTALPLHSSTLLSLLQSWIFLFFHLFFFPFIFSPGSSLARHRFPSAA